MDRNSSARDEGTEINLLELVYAMLSHWLLLFIVTALFGACAFCYSKFFIAPQYSASCTLFVLNRNNSNSLTSSDISASNALLKDYEILAGSRTVINQVIESLDLKYDEARPDKPSYSYAELKREISVSVPKDSRMLVVSVRDLNPNNAKLLADAVSKALVEQITKTMKTEAEILDTAVTPGGPVSPNVKKNTVVGAAIGFLLAAAWVFIRFISDDTIKSEEDVENHLGVPVLGSIPLDETEAPKKKRSEYRAEMKNVRRLYSGKERR